MDESDIGADTDIVQAEAYTNEWPKIKEEPKVEENLPLKVNTENVCKYLAEEVRLFIAVVKYIKLKNDQQRDPTVNYFCHTYGLG